MRRQGRFGVGMAARFRNHRGFWNDIVLEVMADWCRLGS